MFVDRLKDVIRRRGENISSFEVEADVLQNPEIVEAAAVAVPADTAEDEILLFAVKRSGSSISPEELCADLESRMARFMVPRYIEFVDGLAENPGDSTHHQVRLASQGPGAPHVGPAEQGVSQSSECVVKLGIVRGTEYDDRRRDHWGRLPCRWRTTRIPCGSVLHRPGHSGEVPSPTTAPSAMTTRCTTRMTSGCTWYRGTKT